MEQFLNHHALDVMIDSNNAHSMFSVLEKYDFVFKKVNSYAMIVDMPLIEILSFKPNMVLASSTSVLVSLQCFLEAVQSQLSAKPYQTQQQHISGAHLCIHSQWTPFKV